MTTYSENNFEDINHSDVDGSEFWYARELQTILEYKQWRRFSDTIDRAKLAFETSGNVANEDFPAWENHRRCLRVAFVKLLILNSLVMLVI